MAEELAFAGLTTLDAVQLHRGQLAWGEKHIAEGAYVDVGGPAANAAVTARSMGAAVHLVSLIGNRGAGPLVHQLLTHHGVVVSDLATQDSSPPVSSVWVDVDSGDRTVLSTNAVEGSTDSSPPRRWLESTVPPAAVLVDGHHVALATCFLDGLEEVEVVMDAGSWKDQATSLLHRADTVIASSRFRVPGVAPDPTAQCRALRNEFGVREAAVTRGGEDIVAVDEHGEVRLPVPQVQAIDTLGAGDVLHGAFMVARYREGLDFRAALERAAELASSSVKHVGPRRFGNGSE